MRHFGFFSLILLPFFVISAPAHASFLSDAVCWFIPCEGHGTTQYTRPYLHDGKIPQDDSAYEKDDWTPEDWIDEGRTAQDVVSGFYRARIITDQSKSLWHGIPEIEVGQGFMKLSTIDKRHVIRFVDYVSGYTKNDPNGVVLIYHKASGDQIGVYNREGLRLQ